MTLLPYFKSVLEQDKSAVVICNLDHEIIYMNKSAIRNYSNRGGAGLLGKSLLNCHNAESNKLIKKVVDWFAQSKSNNIIYTYHNEKENKDVYMVALRDENEKLIGYYEKHEYRNRETDSLYNFG